jgi:DNA-directed RNA polymerase specialized sigma24 family protein
MAEAGRKIDPVVAEVTRVYEALTRLAIKECKKVKCYGPDAVVPGTGKTARDLASDTLVKLYVRGWSPGAGGEDILPLGRVILKNMFTDLVRSSAFRTNVSLDREEVEKLKEAHIESKLQKLIELRSVIGKMKTRLTDESENAYLDALEKGAKTRQDFADDLGKTPEEVTKIQNRLLYKSKKMRELL